MSWTVLVPEALVGLAAFGAWLAPARRTGRTRWLPARLELPALASAVLLAAWITELSAGAATGVFFHGGFVQDRLALDAKSFLILAGLLAVLLTDWEIADHSSQELSLLLWAVFGGLVAASAGSLAGLWAGSLLAVAAAAAALTGLPGAVTGAIRGTAPSLGYQVAVAAAGLLLMAALALAFVYATAGESDLAGIPARLAEGTTSGTLAVASVAALTGLGAALVAAGLLLRSAGAWPAESSLAAGPAAGLAAGTAAIAVLRLVAALIGSAAAWSPYLAVVAAALLAAGGVGAIAARSLRSLVGWLAVAQAGWIVAGVAAHQRAPVAGALFLLGAFLIALCGLTALLGEDILDRLGALAGQAVRAPLTAAAVAAALLSLAGVPPLGGWFGVISVAAPLAATGYFWLLGIGVGAALLMLVAVLRSLWLIFLTTPPEGQAPALGPLQAIGAVALLAAIIGFGFFANPLHGLAVQGAEALSLP